MAERKRRGDDAVDDRLDETFDDDIEVDDELADDELDDDDDDDVDIDDDDFEDDDEDDEPAARSNGRGRSTSLTKTKTRTKQDAKDAKDAKSDTRPGKRGKSVRPGDKKSTRTKSGDRPNLAGRLVNFIREVVAELRKVIWPTRKELLSYTAVVVVFVALMIAIVFAFDWVFAKGTLWVFGEGGSATE